MIYLFRTLTAASLAQLMQLVYSTQRQQKPQLFNFNPGEKQSISTWLENGENEPTRDCRYTNGTAESLQSQHSEEKNAD